MICLLLYIDACVREDSRTRRLADRLAARLGETEVRRVALAEADIPPLEERTLDERTRLADAEDFSAPLFEPAKALAAADDILIAAPYWDYSFPALLKAWVEAVNVTGLAFRYSPEGVPIGLCRAKRLFYVTTAGGPITELSFGYGYIETMAKVFWGVPETRLVKAEGLDIVGADVEGILAAAEKEIDALVL